MKRLVKTLTTSIVVVLVAATAHASIFAKYDGVDGEVIASDKDVPHTLIRLRSSGPSALEIGGDCSKLLPVKLAGISGKALLLPTVQAFKGDYGVRSTISLNFAEIRGQRDSTIRLRARGPLNCSFVEFDGEVTTKACEGAYDIKSNSGETRIEGAIDHSMTAFFIDDIIIGVKDTRLTLDADCSLR